MTVSGICQERMRTRTGFNMQQIRRALEQKGVVLLAPPSYRNDQEKIRKYSDKIRKRLARFSELKVDDATSIPIPRPVALAAASAAAAGSLLIVGEPGAGKTGVIYNVAKELEASGNSPLMLAVDDAGSINLQTEIGVEHPIRDVLEHWPGTDPAYLRNRSSIPID
jgi:signal recognition particle GTPase